ncbi:MAG: L,D-transpeptidase [Chloroflexaceae bacterium]|nr:L,D-transpeptidase [Chloroflexaceae bacterium]
MVRQRRIAALVTLLVILAGLWGGIAGLRAQETGFIHPLTGQRLDNRYGFLTYWREHQGEQLFGAPVTTTIEEQGVIVQYFERSRLEYHHGPDGPQVLVGRVGAEYAEAIWRVFDPPPVHGAAEGLRIFEATGYAVNEPFLGFWETNRGIETLGYPLSEPVWEQVGDQMLQVQYFERGRLERHPVGNGMPDEVRVSSLGYELAVLRGYDVTSPAPGQVEGILEIPPAPIPTLSPTPSPTPIPTATPVPSYLVNAPAPLYSSGKHIIVSLSQQWLYAFNGQDLVFTAPVSTGRSGFDTPTGNFAIYLKVLRQTMSGTIRGEYYSVPNVPHAMYITGDVAMHGTYWHNRFGSGVRMSHGCINLPLDSAAWLYNWAPVGTPVQVRN